jgi:hypothetical protein
LITLVKKLWYRPRRDEVESSFKTEIVLISEMERGERKQNSKTVAMLKCATIVDCQNTELFICPSAKL